MSDSSPSSPNPFEADLVDDSSNFAEKGEGEIPSSEEKPTSTEETSLSAAEQRQKRREELLERQQQARQAPSTPTTSTTANPALPVETPEPVKESATSTPVSTPTSVPSTSSSQTTEASEPAPRPQMIAQALSFLNSPNVQSAPMSKKIAFLQKKGLTQAEIDAAVEKSSAKDSRQEPATPNSMHRATSSAAVPPVPPRTYAQPAPAPISIMVAPNPNTERIRKTIVALMITSGLTAGLLGLFKLVMLPIRNSLTQEQHLRYDQQLKNVQQFHEELKSYHQTLQSSEDGPLKTLEKSTQTLRRTLRNFETQLMVYQEISKSKERSMNDVKNSFYDLTRSLGSAGYFSVYKLQAEHRSGLPAQIRSDIRSIKGLLLSRRTPFNSAFQQPTVA
ncbi:hypothetical protein K493DRAFT_313491 [Basidiobolus meristosporus CBS 931.73]|uniref:Peroxisomal membrane protein PEX14 n=1 Tax=Basidiobolus meristosporus CBS 931.73 TaxID=1314790 RepID=A0A1Y1YLT5_9FUNG|nr:hypothetical protein K493DRAFT_313491 [Basidiobolus meristosporus CBS 931.73]|eukprot:ORX98803.1 hypothetical protein K493DRAFT_313491 [Basidiobolus meristosporus CBS 931.73]